MIDLMDEGRTYDDERKAVTGCPCCFFEALGTASVKDIAVASVILLGAVGRMGPPVVIAVHFACLTPRATQTCQHPSAPGITATVLPRHGLNGHLFTSTDLPDTGFHGSPFSA